MAVQFIPIVSDEQINALAIIANIVWHEWFPSILSTEQIDYMVDKFQSYKAMKSQVENGYEYYFVNVDGVNVGYTGIHIENDTNKMFVSKVYLLKDYRGKGYASKVFDFLEGICREKDLKSMYLTVNKYNSQAIAVYENKGFETIKSQVADIGNGYVMDDYVMEKTIQ